MSVLDKTYNNNDSGFDLDVYEPGTDAEEQRLKIAQKQHGILCGRPGDKIPGLLDLPYHLRGPVMYDFSLPKAYLKLPASCSDCLLHCTFCLQKKDQKHSLKCAADHRRCYVCNYYGHIAAACPDPDKKLIQEEKEEGNKRSIINGLPSEQKFRLKPTSLASHFMA